MMSKNNSAVEGRNVSRNVRLQTDQVWLVYLRWLVWDGHTLPLCVWIFEILSPLAALHSDQMAAAMIHI